jgi:hypothetical protein
MTDAVAISLITGCISLASTCATLYVNSVVARLKITADANAQHLAETHVAIKELEKNTNSIKDELVKVTGQKAYAEGLKAGTDVAIALSVTPGPVGERGPQGDPGPQGPKGPGGGLFK